MSARVRRPSTAEGTVRFGSVQHTEWSSPGPRALSHTTMWTLLVSSLLSRHAHKLPVRPAPTTKTRDILARNETRKRSPTIPTNGPIRTVTRRPSKHSTIVMANKNYPCDRKHPDSSGWAFHNKGSLDMSNRTRTRFLLGPQWLWDVRVCCTPRRITTIIGEIMHSVFAKSWHWKHIQTKYFVNKHFVFSKLADYELFY